MRATAESTTVDKVEAKRFELADATLETLGELGYARTSLREIAERSGHSHGLLHYYFADKTDLIVFGVRRYKTQCVTRYDDVIASTEGARELAEGVAVSMVKTLIDDAAMHRLWYDLRTQAMFDPELRPAITSLDAQLEQMIWRVVTEYAVRTGRPALVSSARAYALFDGTFEQALGRRLAGSSVAAAELHENTVWLLDVVVPQAMSAGRDAA